MWRDGRRHPCRDAEASFLKCCFVGWFPDGFQASAGQVDCVMDSISCLEKSLADGTTPNRRDDFQPLLLISTIPSRCTSEMANWNVDSETGSLESMGSDLEA